MTVKWPSARRGRIAAAAALVLAAALIASWIPARSGTRVDPVVTLRSE